MNLSRIILAASFVLVSCNADSPQRSYAIASATPEATQAGFAILEKGGNAIDAAIAVAFTLAVTEPAMTGLGAGIQILISKPGEEPFMINGTTYSPAATPVNATEEDISFQRRSTIPSFVKTLDFAFENYGSEKVKWEELLQPAVDYARNGFTIGLFRGKVYKKYEQQLIESPYHMEHYLIDGEAPQEGDVLRLPKLATTLQRLAKHGADDFYQGEIAKTIAADMLANGGWMTLADLNNFPTPSVVPAVHTTYKDYSVFTSTPPCGGWVVLLALNVMEQISTNNDNDSRHKDLIRALTMAHGERQKFPIENMMEYQAAVANKISKAKAIELIDHNGGEPKSLEKETIGETTHFSIVDKDGVAVSITTSINAYFGSRAASSELGFIYNSYMEDFIYGDTTHSFAVGPNKMAYSSMSPTVIRDKDGNNLLALGSPGSARIISAVAQTAQYWMDVDQNIAEAINIPRVHVNGHSAYLEFEPSDSLLNYMMVRGYKLPSVDTVLSINQLNAYFGGVHAVAFENGRWVGAADPRRDGTAKNGMTK